PHQRALRVAVPDTFLQPVKVTTSSGSADPLTRRRPESSTSAHTTSQASWFRPSMRWADVSPASTVSAGGGRSRRGSGRCSATIRGRLAMLSSFGEWLVLRNRLPRNPIDQLTRPRLKDHLPRVPRRGSSWGNRPRFGAAQPRRAMRWSDVYVFLLADG